MAASSDPVVTVDPGAAEAGVSRKLLLDEMLAERARPPLPPAPVLAVEPAPVDAAAVAGRRGAKKRLAEVEALARRNLRAAEEARRVVHEERQLLEEEASARTQAERTAAALRRELERMRATEEQRAAQARFAATHEARSELATEIERVHDEHARVVDELDRMRGTLFDHDSLLDEYSRRLRDEQDAQNKARAEQVRAEEQLHVVERNLEIATETARRRAEEELARFTKVEDAWRDACAERDRVSAELHRITTGDGELARLRTEIDATHEDMTRVLAELDTQHVRADAAENELATTREALVRAEQLASEATEARDLAGISLETTRCELAEKTEALDAERSAAQTRIADLVAELSTATRTAESATERSSDLESRLDGTILARDEAVARAETLGEQLARARADTEVLRTQAASIGDELAATQGALDRVQTESQAAIEAAREETRAAREAAQARAYEMPPPAPPIAELDPMPAMPAAAVPQPVAHDAAVAPPAGSEAVSTFDAALASAFGDAASAEVPVDSREVDNMLADNMLVESDNDETTKPATKFRTVDADPDSRAKRAGGPIVDIELALARGIEPVDLPSEFDDGDESDGEVQAGPERSPETETWRRTAMAELTALATDSDDLTPKRRR